MKRQDRRWLVQLVLMMTLASASAGWLSMWILYQDVSAASAAGDASEVRAHFSRAAVWEGLAALTTTAIAALLFLRISTPITRRLEQSEARSRTIVATAINGIVTLDTRGIVHSLNPAAERLFGYRAEELVGKSVKSLMPWPHDESYHDDAAAVLGTVDGGFFGTDEEEPHGRRKDGALFPLELAVSEPGSDGIFTAIVSDITHRRRAEQEREKLIAVLERANDELERYAYTVSHDLKTPLTTIMAYAEWARRDLREGDTANAEKRIQRIHRAGTRMRELLDDLLKLSRSGQVTNEPTEIALGAFVADVVDSLAGAIGERGAEVVVASGMPDVRADRVRLREVLQNLIENAIKFTAGVPSPRIEIGAETRDAEVVCHVRDNGVGLDPEHADKVFGLFEQLDKSRGGTGIGLTLVKRIAESAGGRAWVESDGLGTGSTFYFALPAPHASQRE